MLWKELAVKFDPRSIRRNWHGPWMLTIISIMKRLAVSAVQSLVGSRMMNFLDKQLRTWIYRLPRWLTLMGPAKSKEQKVKDLSDTVIGSRRPRACFLIGCLAQWHSSHERTYCNTLVASFRNQYLCLSLLSVALIPVWLAKHVLWAFSISWVRRA